MQKLQTGRENDVQTPSLLSLHTCWGLAELQPIVKCEIIRDYQYDYTYCASLSLVVPQGCPLQPTEGVALLAQATVRCRT